jgi:hypothetical protein
MIVYSNDHRSCLTVKVLARYFVFPILMFVPRVTLKLSCQANVYDIIEGYASFLGLSWGMYTAKDKGAPQ